MRQEQIEMHWDIDQNQIWSDMERPSNIDLIVCVDKIEEKEPSGRCWECRSASVAQLMCVCWWREEQEVPPDFAYLLEASP